MQSLSNELKVEIFKLVNVPISLVLADRSWYNISKDSYVRAEWLIFKYGKSHSLFHALRLGKNFVTTEVIQSLLKKNAIISRYFVQRLLMHFGGYDEKLVGLKIEHNVNQANVGRINEFRKKLATPWSSDLPLPIFTKLMSEGYKIDNDLAAKGNDMELFHFLSAGPLVISQAPQRLFQNIKEIEDLISNKKFIPFPPRPKPNYEDTEEYNQLMQARSHEEYPPKDGYENSRQLNVIARAILIYPDLVLLWKKIGYYEICSDVNDLVLQGALLILFPPTPPSDWERPSAVMVVDRLKQLIGLGFKLTDSVMEEAFHLFENKLDEIGEILIDSFKTIHNKSISDIACSCLIQAIKPERNHNKIDLLEFLIYRIDQPQEALKNALEYYNVGFKFDTNSIRSTKKVRSLSVNSNFYYWVLKKFGIKSEITQKCFEDILESRIWIDLKLQGTPERERPANLTGCALNSICSIYLEFCNERIPFKANHLPYLQLAKNEEIIKPFFEISLPITFGMTWNYELLPFKINYQYNRPKIPTEDNILNNQNETLIEIDKIDKIDKWTKSLDSIKHYNSTETFKIHFEEFRQTLEFNNSEIGSKRLKYGT